MFDWIGRTLLLVLSGLATLSIIASVAAVSNIHRSNDVPPIERSATETSQGMVAGAPPRMTTSEAEEAIEVPGDGADLAIAESDSPDNEIARWLESLTYAVLALAGFLAAAVLVLLRITALLARIADR